MTVKEKRARHRAQLTQQRIEEKVGLTDTAKRQRRSRARRGNTLEGRRVT